MSDYWLLRTTSNQGRPVPTQDQTMTMTAKTTTSYYEERRITMFRRTTCENECDRVLMDTDFLFCTITTGQIMESHERTALRSAVAKWQLLPEAYHCQNMRYPCVTMHAAHEIPCTTAMRCPCIISKRDMRCPYDHGLKIGLQPTTCRGERPDTTNWLST